MKKLFLLFLMIPLHSFSQIEGDWHPFPEGQTSYFADIPEDSSSNYQYMFLSTLRIDSIVNLSGLDYYYNMRSPVKIGSVDEYSYYDPYSSWIGKFMNVYGNYVLFSDMSGKNYTINISKTDDYPHLSALISDTSILLVTLDSMTYGTIIDGLMDSLKYFSFHYHRNFNTPIDHQINGKQMVFSKNYGLIKTFSFGLYSSINNFKVKDLIGLRRNEEAYGYQWDMDSITTAYQIGDEYQIFIDEGDMFYQYYLIEKELEDNYIDYTYQRCIDKNNPRLDTVNQRIQINLMPGQSNFREEKGFCYVHMYKDEVFGRRTYMLRYYDDIKETYFANQFVWEWLWPGSSTGIIPPYYHINSAGKYLYRDNSEQSPHELLYYFNHSETWGEPHVFPCNVGIDESLIIDLQVYPNPSNGLINLSSSEKIEELKVFNLNGQIVWLAVKLEGDKIDLSELENGIYLMSLQTKSQNIIYQKVIINK